MNPNPQTSKNGDSQTPAAKQQLLREFFLNAISLALAKQQLQLVLVPVREDPRVARTEIPPYYSG